MPFLIPVAAAFVVGAVGSALGGATLGAVLTAGLIDAGVTLGTELLLQAVTPQPKSPGQQLGVSLDPATPRVVLFGQSAVAGSLVTFTTWGSSNENIILVFALADHECAALVGGWWMGERMTINEDGSVEQSKYQGNYYLWVRFYPGSWDDQIDETLLNNSGGRWNSGAWGRGVCKVVIQATYNANAHPQGLAGLFQFIWELQGSTLYDRRQDSTVGGSGAQLVDRKETWAWTNNGAVVVENLLRGFREEDTTEEVGARAIDALFGLNFSDLDLPFAQNVAGMNNCDEQVSQLNNGAELSVVSEAGTTTLNLTSVLGLVTGVNITVGVGTAQEEVHTVLAISGLEVVIEAGLAYAHGDGQQVSWTSSDDSAPLVPRYALNGWFNCDSDGQTVLQNMLQSIGDGRLLTGSGVNYVILPGVVRTSVARPDGGSGATITDLDLRLDGPHKYQQYAQLDQIINAVYGRWSNPEAYYQGIPLPARISTSDEAEDGGKKDLSFDVIYSTASSQGQRCQEIKRRRSRSQMSAQLCLSPAYVCLEGGDWVDWQSDRYGFEATFEVQNSRWVLDDNKNLLGVIVDLQQIETTVYDWDPDIDELSLTDPTTLPSADPSAAEIADFTVTAVAISDPTTGAQRPALTFTWANVSDIFAASVLLEWRVHGTPSTASQTFSLVVPVDPTTATDGGVTTVTVTDGVNSELLYEARAVEQTSPVRFSEYTSWTEANTITPGTYVALSAAVPWTGVTNDEGLRPANNATVGATVDGSGADNLYGPTGVLSPNDIITSQGTSLNTLNLGEYTVEQAVLALGAATAAAQQLFANVDTLAESAMATALQGVVTNGYIDQQTHIDGVSLIKIMNLLAVMGAGGEAVDLQTDTVVIDATTGETFATRLTTLAATDATASANAVIEQSARISADSALATLIAATNATVSSNAASTASSFSSQATWNSATASSLTAISTTVSGHTATLSAYGTSIGGLLLKYSLALDSNGKISGVVYNNDGSLSSTTFIDDLFAIGAATGTFSFQPFLYDATDGVLYLNEIFATSGNFQDLTLDGVKLSLNAATVSAVDIAGTTYGVGYGTYIQVGSCDITVDEDAFFTLTGSWVMNQSSGLTWGYQLVIDGTVVDSGTFNLAQGIATKITGAFLSAGDHTAAVNFTAPTTTYASEVATIWDAKKK